MNSTDAPRPRLTIVSENYWPEVASTAQLMTELAEGLAEEFAVEVLTAQPRYHGTYERRPRQEVRNGVEIRRLRGTAFSKQRPLGRLANWLTFFASVCLAVIRRWRTRSYLFVTNPPTAPWACPIARLLRHRSFILVYDLYPDLAEATGAVRQGGLLAKAFDAVNKFSFRRATALVAVGRDMQLRLTEKLGESARVVVIPNWVDPSHIAPAPKASSRFAHRAGLTDRFVFLYAGNLGLFQDLETLVTALTSLDGAAEGASLVFVGDGGKRHKLEGMAATSERVHVFDYVPYDQLGDLYAAADVGLIALEPGVEKTNVPSKTYSIMAAGRPFLAVARNSSDLAALADQGCGVVVGNEATAVASAMEALITDPETAKAMGRQASRVFSRHFTRSSAVERYRRLLLPEQRATQQREAIA